MPMPMHSHKQSYTKPSSQDLEMVVQAGGSWLLQHPREPCSLALGISRHWESQAPRFLLEKKSMALGIPEYLLPAASITK